MLDIDPCEVERQVTETNAYDIVEFGNAVVARKLKKCVIGCRPNGYLPPYIEGAINTIRVARDNAEKGSEISVPYIINTWEYEEGYKFLKEMEFVTHIDYALSPKDEELPGIIQMIDGPFIVRARTVALFYNMVTTFQSSSEHLPVPIYTKLLGTALLSLMKSMFIDNNRYASIIPIGMIRNNVAPSKYLSFDDEHLYETPANHPYEYSESDSDSESESNDMIVEGENKPGLAIVLRPRGPILKKDEILYYGEDGTAYFMYIDVVRGNDLLDDIMAYYSTHRESYRHKLVLVSIRNYVRNTLFSGIKTTRVPNTDTVWLDRYEVRMPANNKVWSRLIDEYKEEENAKRVTSGAIMRHAPDVDHLKDPSKIAIVITTQETRPEKLQKVDGDPDNHKRIVGYVTCSLHSIDPMTRKPNGVWHNRDLEMFADDQRMMSDYKPSVFDIYHIDGLHVSEDARGQKLAQLLIYYAMEFIEAKYEELGVTMTTCDAAADPTRHILEKFGFSHYNEENSLYFIQVLMDEILGEFVEYKKKRNESLILRINPNTKAVTRLGTYPIENSIPIVITNRLAIAIERYEAHCKTYGDHSLLANEYIPLLREFRALNTTVVNYMESVMFRIIQTMKEMVSRLTLFASSEKTKTTAIHTIRELMMSKPAKRNQYTNNNNEVEVDIQAYINELLIQTQLSGMTTFHAMGYHKGQKSRVYKAMMADMRELVAAHGHHIGHEKRKNDDNDTTQTTNKKAKQTHSILFSSSFFDSML